MRDLEIGTGDRFVAVKQDIQIDEAGALGEGLLAAQGRFDFSHPAQEFLRRQIGFGFEDGIQEPGLFEVIDGRRFVDAGGLFHGDSELAQAPLRFAKILFAIADVTSERQIDECHAILSLLDVLETRNLPLAKPKRDSSLRRLRSG